MQVFDFAPETCAAMYQQQGWVLIPGGIAPDFLAFARAAEAPANEFGIEGKKQQTRIELPVQVSLNTLFDVVCAVTGLDRRRIVLSERHLQTYDPGADPYPHAHKDWRSSQVSVGLTLRTTPESRLNLWPEEDRKPNVADKAAYADPRGFMFAPLRIHDHVGDVVMFGGASTWHRREHAAGVTNLYLKFNDFGHDPLGEDPRT